MAGFLENLFDPQVLYDVLKEQNLLPDWSPGIPLTGNVGEYYPDYNKLVANRPYYPNQKNTLAHEMSHAVQTNLMDSMGGAIAEKQWNKQPVLPEEEQYFRALRQLRAVQPGRIGQYDRREADDSQQSLEQLIKGLYKSPNTDNKEYNSYRTTPKEAQAFGIGGMSKGADPNFDKVGNHFDPTMATEFNILLDLYQRLPRNVRDQAAEQRRKEVEAARQNISKKSIVNEYDYLPPPYKNPFLK